MLSGFYGQSNEDGRLKSLHDPLEALEKRPDFFVSEEDFSSLVAWHLAFAEKRELFGVKK